MPRTLLPCLALLLCARLPGAPALDVRPTATPPVIDGRLDDPAWREAAHTDAFRQVYPGENVAPTERTEIWVTFDADHVFVGVRCHDSGGLAGLRAYSMQRDQANGSDDLVRVVFDTFHRQSDGYYFGLTAAGGKHDGLVQNKDQPNDQWDGLWFGKVTRDPGGWSAEFAIPVKTIAFDPAGGTWGFDVARQIRRKQETVRWSNLVRVKGVFSLPETGELRGVAGSRQRAGEDEIEVLAGQPLTEPAGGCAAVVVQRDVGAPGVPQCCAPVRLAVPGEPDLGLDHPDQISVSDPGH